MNTKETDEAVADLTELVGHDTSKDSTNVYEVGYHILPTVAEDSLETEVNKITDALKGFKAEFIGERLPTKVDLAYAIEKKIDGNLRSFDGAYFGWVAFEMDSSLVAKLEETLAAHENVLRYIIIKTSRDSVAATIADPGLDIGSPKQEEPEEGEVSEQELDKALDDIENKEEV